MRWEAEKRPREPAAVSRDGGQAAAVGLSIKGTFGEDVCWAGSEAAYCREPWLWLSP